MLKQETTERQNQIVARIFSALSMKLPEDDQATEELLAEWRDALAKLSIDEITERVRYWKARGATCPADEFAKPTGQKQDKMTGIVDKAKRLYGESEMTFQEAYDHLELAKRWGSLPKERT